MLVNFLPAIHSVALLICKDLETNHRHKAMISSCSFVCSKWWYSILGGCGIYIGESRGGCIAICTQRKLTLSNSL